MTTTSTISITRAASFVIPFGPYEGLTFDETASSVNGLLYLDRLQDNKSLFAYFRVCLDAYMSQESVQKEIEAAMADRMHPGNYRIGPGSINQL